MSDADRPLYPANRQPVFGRAAVATSQPLAVSAGLGVLRRGGSAADAAVIMAATLTVVEPTSNGIGGDCFALLHHPEDGLVGMNASGRSPAGWTRDRFPAAGEMPLTGVDSVTVPGQVRGWALLHARYGRLPFDELLKPAIAYAREGFPCSPITAAAWGRAAGRFRAFPEWARVFTPVPEAGQVVRLPDHADTLEAIAADGGRDFYEGELARRIAEAAGAMTTGDLAACVAEWVEPMGVGYRGHTLHELPPNGQGLAALIAVGLLDRHPAGDGPDDPLTLHRQIEATKLALADAYAHVGDPAAMPHDPAAFLDPAYLDRRATLIGDTAADAPAGTPTKGGTVYLAAADADGLRVSFIQSNYHGFGSGVVVPGTGIALQNRGHGFTLTPGHPNEVGPSKRPFHTIIPAMLTRRGEPALTFGVMGGPMQAQGHVQMTCRHVGHGQDPQACSDAPRWQAMPDLGPRTLWVEPAMPAATVAALEARGHVIDRRHPANFGGAQLIAHLPNDVHCAGSDHRKDGHAAAF